MVAADDCECVCVGIILSCWLEEFGYFSTYPVEIWPTRVSVVTYFLIDRHTSESVLLLANPRESRKSWLQGMIERL